VFARGLAEGMRRGSPFCLVEKGSRGAVPAGRMVDGQAQQ